MKSFYTPSALRHDAAVLAEEAAALVSATAEATDEKVVAARDRLRSTLVVVKETTENLQSRFREGLHSVEETARQHPHETVLVALGLGVLAGCWLCCRSRA